MVASDCCGVTSEMDGTFIRSVISVLELLWIFAVLHQEILLAFLVA